MKKMILAALLAWPSYAGAVVAGKLDLDLNIQTLGLRELNDGNWLAGVGKQLWHLEVDGKERLHFGVFQAWRANQGDPAFGLSLGVTTGGLGDYITKAIDLGTPGLGDYVKWVPQIANLISIETFGGYRPSHGPDVHPWIYGVGGYLKIPLDLIKGL